MMKNIVLIASLMMMSAFAVEIDVTKSKLKWLGKKVTGKHEGTVEFSKGKLEMDKKGNLTGGELVVNLDKITVTDLTGEWKTKLENHLKNEDFFNTKKYPTSKLVIKKVEAGNLIADLTIKKTTKEIKIPFTVTGNTYKGKFVFNRAEFDVKYGSGKFFDNLGDKMIYDDVNMDFEIVVKK